MSAGAAATSGCATKPVTITIHGFPEEQPTWFRTGLAISVVGWLAAIGGLVWAVRGRKA